MADPCGAADCVTAPGDSRRFFAQLGTNANFTRPGMCVKFPEERVLRRLTGRDERWSSFGRPSRLINRNESRNRALLALAPFSPGFTMASLRSSAAARPVVSATGFPVTEPRLSSPLTPATTLSARYGSAQADSRSCTCRCAKHTTPV